MNIKIILHLMPWELDHGLLTIDKLKQSIYNINSSDKIYIDTVLNLSSFIINWKTSILQKEFFIEKYQVLCKLLNEPFIHKSAIYDKDDLYGHLDFQKTVIESQIDYYILLCPDIEFSNNLLYYLIESAKLIDTKYFLITPQIFKCWDNHWDILVNENFSKYPYNDCMNVDIHKIRHICNNIKETPEVALLNSFRFAGWFDLYNKNFYEKLVPVLDDWHGYGPWDTYSTNICQIAKLKNVDVNQYLLKNEIVWFYDVGCMFPPTINSDGYLKSSYKNFITINHEKQILRKNIEAKFLVDINKWNDYAIKNNII